MKIETNLGQSQFQDTFFVAGAQLTPFRQLRQLDLEIRSLEDSLKRASFTARRLQLKMETLHPDNPQEAIDLEEAEWDMQQQQQVVADAKARLANFNLMREQLIERTPKEYWDQGFENAEIDHWTKYVGKQISMAKAMGLPPPQQMIEMLLQLPESAQHNALLLSNQGAMQLADMDQQVLQQLENSNK